MPVLKGPSDRSRRDPDYAVVARKLSQGKTTAVYCWSATDWAKLLSYKESAHIAGFVRHAARGPINLGPDVCADLDAIHYERAGYTPSIEFAFAVNVLAHEAVHTTGIRNEAVTECYAMQLIENTSVDLGETRRYGRALATIMWTSYHRFGPRFFPPRYRTPRCRNGGPLDLHPRSDVWP